MDKIIEIINMYPEIKLELGSGIKQGTNGWITLDRFDGCDINWDLVLGIPFPDSSVSIIYSSHLLEHFTFKEIQKLLLECFRVLHPGGIFSIAVPNARLFIDAYLRNDEKFWYNLPLHYFPAYDNTNSLIDLINYIAYMDGHHKYMFDEDNLINILKSIGFINVRLRDFDSSIDSNERKHESIFAVANKP